MSNAFRTRVTSLLHKALVFGAFAVVFPLFSRFLPETLQISGGSGRPSKASTMSSPVDVVSESATTVLEGQSTLSSDPTAPNAPLSPANILWVLRGLYSIGLYLLNTLFTIGRFLVISFLKLASLPFIHGTRLTFSSLKLAVRPALPLLAPAVFASKIILIVILAPLGVLYAVAGLMYPAYVLLGGAVVIGVVVGLSSRLTAWAILEGVLGIRLAGSTDKQFRPEKKKREKRRHIKPEVQTTTLPTRRKVYW